MPNALQTIRAAANEAQRRARCALRRRRCAMARTAARRGDPAHGRGAAGQARFRRRSVHGRVHAERMRQASVGDAFLSPRARARRLAGRRATSISASSCSPPAGSRKRSRASQRRRCSRLDDPDAWCSRAGTLRELGRLEELVEAAERALELRHDFPEAAINLGNALLKLDRSEEAFERLSQGERAGALPGQGAVGSGSGVAKSWPLLGG